MYVVHVISHIVTESHLWTKYINIWSRIFIMCSVGLESYLCHELMFLCREVIILWYEVTSPPSHLGLQFDVASPQLVLPVQRRGGGKGVHLQGQLREK